MSSAIAKLQARIFSRSMSMAVDLADVIDVTVAFQVFGDSVLVVFLSGDLSQLAAGDF